MMNSGCLKCDHLKCDRCLDGRSYQHNLRRFMNQNTSSLLSIYEVHANRFFSTIGVQPVDKPILHHVKKRKAKRTNAAIRETEERILKRLRQFNNASEEE